MTRYLLAGPVCSVTIELLCVMISGKASLLVDKCVNPQGHSFISRLLDMVFSIPNLLYLISLKGGCRSDLCFGLICLSTRFSSMMSWSIIPLFSTFCFFTDAVPSVLGHRQCAVPGASIDNLNSSLRQ